MKWCDQTEMKSNALLHRVQMHFVLHGRERTFLYYFPVFIIWSESYEIDSFQNDDEFMSTKFVFEV